MGRSFALEAEKVSAYALGEPIGRGRTAEIYRWGEGWVLKLFNAGYDRTSIEREAAVTRQVQASGLPAPAVGEIVEVDGRVGVIYERIDGPTMGDAIKSDLRLLQPYAKQLAQLHVQMHSADVAGELPTQKSKLEWKIRRADALSGALQHKALAALAAMPGAISLCHGDWHPENVLLTDNGPIMIDWMDASRGNPLADVARTSITLLGEAQNRENPSELRQVIVEFHNIYLDEYFRLRPRGEDEYVGWLPIVAAARLSEAIPQVQDWLIAQARF